MDEAEKEELKALLLANVVCGEGGCWVWIGPTVRDGYGYIRIAVNSRNKTRLMTTHRVAFEVFKGPILPGMSVLHSCDRPNCLRPDHLRLRRIIKRKRISRARPG